MLCGFFSANSQKERLTLTLACVCLSVCEGGEPYSKCCWEVCFWGALRTALIILILLNCSDPASPVYYPHISHTSTPHLLHPALQAHRLPIPPTPGTDRHRIAHMCTYSHEKTGTDMYRPVQTGTYKYIQVQTGTDMYRQVHTSTDRHRHVQTCTDMYRHTHTPERLVPSPQCLLACLRRPSLQPVPLPHQTPSRPSSIIHSNKPPGRGRGCPTQTKHMAPGPQPAYPITYSSPGPAKPLPISSPKGTRLNRKPCSPLLLLAPVCALLPAPVLGVMKFTALFLRCPSLSLSLTHSLHLSRNRRSSKRDYTRFPL